MRLNGQSCAGGGPGIAVGAAVGVLVVQLETVALQIILVGSRFGRRAYGAWQSALALGENLPTGLTRALISPWIGGLSVLIGVGGGSFGVPLMTLHGVPIHRAVGTAAGFGLLIAVPSVIGFFLVDIPQAVRPPFTIGSVNLAAFAIIVGMTLLTAPLGARLAHRLDPAVLRRVFAVFLLLMLANVFCVKPCLDEQFCRKRVEKSLRLRLRRLTGWTHDEMDAVRALRDPDLTKWYECEDTWFVGLDALANDAAGQVAGSAPLSGAGVDFVSVTCGGWPDLHRGQVSGVFPGYPRPRAGETEAGFRYRLNRCAAHVDGVLGVGQPKRRFVREPHAFILGIVLTLAEASAAPLVVTGKAATLY